MLKKLEGLPKIEIECPTCKELFEATIFSRAFSSGEELICSSCGTQARLNMHGAVAKYFENNGFAAADIERYLQNCKCGGRFVFEGRRYDLYRCPKCGQLHREDFILGVLGVDVEIWRSGAPFCANVEIDGEKIDYTNPGLETVGHIGGNPWNYDVDGEGFQNVLKADRESDIGYRKEEEAFSRLLSDVEEKMANGELPQKLYLMEGLEAFLFFKIRNRFVAIDPTALGLPTDLVQDCRGWAKLGSYIEEGTWGEGNIPEAVTKTSWTDYYNAGRIILNRLQAALGNRITVELLVEENGVPFFQVEA